MPRGNGTGPMCMGPRTGRGMGYCAVYNAPGYMNGFDFGMHRGHRRMLNKTGIPCWSRFGYFVDEKAYLKAEAQYLEDQLKYIKDRLDELDKKDNKEDK